MSRISMAVVAMLLSASCVGTREPEVVVEVLGRGIIASAGTTMRPDPSSSVGAQRFDSRGLHVVEVTERIPLRPGLSYGIAFRVVKAPVQEVSLRAVLVTSAACRLKTTGEIVYHNDSTLKVRLGELRHLAARIPASTRENHCVGDPEPGIDTFRLFYGEEKLVEARFQVYREH
jgi:hypothetical protein